VAALLFVAVGLLVLGSAASTSLAVVASRNLQLANSHATRLGEALRSATDEKNRADQAAERAEQEAERAQEAEAAATQRELDAIAARNEANMAKELDQLKSSKEALATATEEVTNAASKRAMAEHAANKAAITAQLANIKVAIGNENFDEARRLLDAVEEGERNPEWTELSDQASSLAVESFDIESFGGSVFADSASRTIVIGKYRTTDWGNDNYIIYDWDFSNSEEVKGRFGGYFQRAGNRELLFLRDDDISLFSKNRFETFRLSRKYYGTPFSSSRQSVHTATIRSGFQSIRGALEINTLTLERDTIRINPSLSRIYPIELSGSIYIASIDRDYGEMLLSNDKGHLMRLKSLVSYSSAPDLRLQSLPYSIHTDNPNVGGDNGVRAKLRNGQIATNTSNKVQIFNDREQIGVITAPAKVEQFAMSPDGAYVAASWGDGELGVWRIKDGSLVRSHKSKSKINDIHIDAKGTMVWAGNKFLHRWRMPDPLKANE
jgi:WD40 repeat protein